MLLNMFITYNPNILLWLLTFYLIKFTLECDIISIFVEQNFEYDFNGDKFVSHFEYILNSFSNANFIYNWLSLSIYSGSAPA